WWYEGLRVPTRRRGVLKDAGLRERPSGRNRAELGLSVPYNTTFSRNHTLPPFGPSVQRQRVTEQDDRRHDVRRDHIAAVVRHVRHARSSAPAAPARAPGRSAASRTPRTRG